MLHRFYCNRWQNGCLEAGPFCNCSQSILNIDRCDITKAHSSPVPNTHLSHFHSCVGYAVMGAAYFGGAPTLPQLGVEGRKHGIERTARVVVSPTERHFHPDARFQVSTDYSHLIQQHSIFGLPFQRPMTIHTCFFLLLCCLCSLLLSPLSYRNITLAKNALLWVVNSLVYGYIIFLSLKSALLHIGKATLFPDNKKPKNSEQEFVISIA